MIVEKPTWLRHEGLQIFSIDIQAGGQRFATSGGDHKVRIWDMKFLSLIEMDTDSNSSKLLATLRDHFGSVNCVRWSNQGRLIASGSDDQIILVHERKAGSGTTEFGSGEPPDVENWKVVMRLRGHTADVVDLGWCSDDSLLASCSLDNTIHIWNMTNGSHITALTGHTSLVKGVAWDPVGSFLASQSDDKTVIIWRTSDWSLAHRVEGHWEKSVGSTFFRRLDWSPCGHFITTTNGFQKPRHSAPVLERGDWTASFDFLGHNAPVVVVRFNHSLFWKQLKHSGSDHESGGVNSQANGMSKHSSKDSLPYNVIAMGSQDCSITVWTTTSARPVFVGKHFFTQSVVDLSWSPDGYSLFCCSLDGSVAAFHFEIKELGYKLSDGELEDLKKNRYGDTRSRQTTMAESPAQLLLESMAAKQWGAVGENHMSKQVNSPLITANSSIPDQSKPDQRKLDSIKAEQGKLDIPPPSVPGQSGQSIEKGASTTVDVKDSQPRILSPVKQREYRRPDGRRRIIPEPVGPQLVDDRMANIMQPSGTLGGQKGDFNSVHAEPDRLVEGSKIDHVFARASVGNTIVVEAGLCAADAAQLGLCAPQSDVISREDAQACKGVLVFSVCGKDDCLPMQVEVRPLLAASCGSLGGLESEVVCSTGGQVQWHDRLAGRATVIAGNSNMWAVGCDDGTLQIYSKFGRRCMPTMMVGSAPAFLDCDNGWKLLLLTRHGALYVWELASFRCLLKESILPLLSTCAESCEKGTLKVLNAKISQSGAPLIVLANRHAFLFHMEMKCWQRVADDQFHASSFSSSLQGIFPAGGTELASLQAAATDASVRNLKWSRGLCEDSSSTRSHLESLMASALAMKSSEDYQNYLLAYTRFLAKEGDEVRLRELCEDLLGPPDSISAVQAQGGDMKSWEPTVLGLVKQELLKTKVLPAMASSRRTQRLLNELIDLLSEKDARQQHALVSMSEA